MTSAFKDKFGQMQADYREQLRDRERLSRMYAALRMVFSLHSADDGVTPDLLSDISTVVCIACPELSGPGAVVVNFEPEAVEILVTFPDDVVIRAAVHVATPDPGDAANMPRLGRPAPSPYDRRNHPPKN